MARHLRWIIFIITLAYGPLALARSPLPRPWKWALWAEEPYHVGLDKTVLFNGQPSLFIDGGPPPGPPMKIGPGRFTAIVYEDSGILQRIKADKYRGSRVQWSAYLRTDKVAPVWGSATALDMALAATDMALGTNPGAGLYVLLDSRDETPQKHFGTLLHLRTRDRLLGTNDWTRVYLVFDVPPSAMVITLGFLLVGTGRVWANGFEFGTVDRSVDTTLARDLDITETEIYQDRVAAHKERLKAYAHSPDQPIFKLFGR